MSRPYRCIAGLALASGLIAPSAAAKEPPKPEPSMSFQLVRSAEPGCEPDCPEWIAAQGKIDEGTLGRFKKMLAKLGARKVPILIDSTGGAVDGSLAIGRLVRAKGLDVVVTKTVLQPCQRDDEACRKLKAKGVALGLPEARISKCASACAFVLAGGNRRHVGNWTLVGVHQLHKVVTQVLRKYRVETRREFGVPVETKRTLLSEKKLSEQTVPTKSTDKAYDKIRRFWTDMGIDPSIMPLLMSAESTSIHWLNRAELVSTGMATDFRNGEQLLLKVATLPPPVRHGLPPAAPGLASEPSAGFKARPSGPATVPAAAGSPVEAAAGPR